MYIAVFKNNGKDYLPRLCHLNIAKSPHKILETAVKSAIFY